MTDVIKKTTSDFFAIDLKDFLVPLHFHVSLPSNLVKNLTEFVLSQYTLVRRYGSCWSKSRKNLKRLKRTGTERFENTYASKTYNNISRKQHSQVLHT